MQFNYVYKIKQYRVIDGDTIDALIDVGFRMTINKRVRFIGIDTEEVRGGTDETKAHGNMATDMLIQLLASGEVMIQTKMDAEGKYGRVLGSLYVKDNKGVIDVTASLIASGMRKGAEPTMGGITIYRVDNNDW